MENEVTLLPNFHFEVKEIKKDKGTGHTYVHINEVPRTNLLNFKKFGKMKIIWLDGNIDN
jgi:hypothetical protein